MFAVVLDRFVQQCPLAVMARMTLQRALRPDCNAFYLNPLQLESGSRVDPHIDRSLHVSPKYAGINADQQVGYDVSAHHAGG